MSMDRELALEQRAGSCETIEDVLEMLETCSEQYLSWQSFVTELL